jgi:putative colanic acid biosynthesis acetyltransferase WcaF
MAQPEAQIQDLSLFRLPQGFRGRSAVTCQLWWLVQDTLFRWSPQFAYRYRRTLLRLFGARIGDQVLVRPTARIQFPWRVEIGENSWVGDHACLYSLGPIKIGKNVVISQDCYLCTGSHDHTRTDFEIWTKPIEIEDEVWLSAAVMVMPGVTIGHGTVVGARSLVLKSLPPLRMAMGSPARDIGPRRGGG